MQNVSSGKSRRQVKNRDSAEDRLDLVFRALGDRTRRAMLAQLGRGSAIIRELAEPFKMSLPAVCKHLRVLERAGLAQRSIDGRVHHCSLQALRSAPSRMARLTPAVLG